MPAAAVALFEPALRFAPCRTTSALVVLQTTGYKLRQRSGRNRKLLRHDFSDDFYWKPRLWSWVADA